jgi:hypothetical protein
VGAICECSPLDMARAALLTFCALFGAGCANPPPQMAFGLTHSLVPTSDFDARIKERFPVGSDERALSAELRRERFSIRAATGLDGSYQFAGYYDRQEFPCRESWTVLWSSRFGTITAVGGRYSGEICL